MRISEKQLRAAVLAYHGDDFFDCFEEGSEFANEKVEAIRAALESAQSAAGTATEIDEAARYLRETLQSGKNLKPWAVTDKGTKRKWLKLAQGTIEAALSAQVQDVAGWQSMDTAPKDGSEFAAGRRYSPDGEFVVHTYRWVGAPNYWLSKRNGVCIRPSYQADYKWCPLPAAPAKQEG